jgi:hypothetical protein
VRVDVVGAERAEALDVGVGDLDTGCFETIERALGVDGVVEHARAQADPTAGAGCVRLSRFPHELSIDPEMSSGCTCRPARRGCCRG